MAYEITRTLEEHIDTVDAFMHMGGEAPTATMASVALAEPITHPGRRFNRTYTHVAAQRYIRPDYERLSGDPTHLVNFTPFLAVELRNPDAAGDEDGAFIVGVSFGDFSLSERILRGAAEIPRCEGLLVPDMYRIGQGAGFIIAETLRSGQLDRPKKIGEPHESGPRVKRAAEAIAAAMNAVNAADWFELEAGLHLS